MKKPEGWQFSSNFIGGISAIRGWICGVVLDSVPARLTTDDTDGTDEEAGRMAVQFDFTGGISAICGLILDSGRKD